MNKKEIIILVLLYVIAAIVINVSYSDTIDKIAFYVPSILGGLGLYMCLEMKHLERSEKILPIFLVASFIIFLFLIAPNNDIYIATYLYNHLGLVVVIGCILIGLVYYIDSERAKSYRTGVFETNAELSKEIDKLHDELLIEKSNTKYAYYDGAQFATYSIHNNLLDDSIMHHEVLWYHVERDLKKLLKSDKDIDQVLHDMKQAVEEKKQRLKRNSP